MDEHTKQHHTKKMYQTILVFKNGHVLTLDPREAWTQVEYRDWLYETLESVSNWECIQGYYINKSELLYLKFEESEYALM